MNFDSDNLTLFQTSVFHIKSDDDDDDDDDEYISFLIKKNIQILQSLNNCGQSNWWWRGHNANIGILLNMK